jgi:hypothetical protein
LLLLRGAGILMISIPKGFPAPFSLKPIVFRADMATGVCLRHARLPGGSFVRV